MSSWWQEYFRNHGGLVKSGLVGQEAEQLESADGPLHHKS
jgi:hypothetical protein